MRTLAVTQNISVDGVIEMVTDWFDPSDESRDQDDVAAATREQSARSDAVLFGRKTFESMRGFWPLQKDDTTGVTDHLNKTHKYVVSSTLTDPEWENSTILHGSVADEVSSLKSSQGRDIVLTGSIQLTHAVIAAGLVDEYRLFVYPTVVGRGRRLFESGIELPRLTLEEQTAFKNGVVLLTYTAP